MAGFLRLWGLMRLRLLICGGWRIGRGGIRVVSIIACRFIFAFECLLLIVCVGCATAAKYEKTVHQWVGRSEFELVSAWGDPEKTTALENGNQLLSYSR